VASNRATVEELIRGMNVRDRHPTHLFHPDIEWHWAAAIPGPSVYRGHEELAKGLDTWIESWDELVVEPQEYLEAPVAHLHQFTEDGLVRRWWMFGDAEKAKRRFLAGDRPG
jgi:hypothetical protein